MSSSWYLISLMITVSVAQSLAQTPRESSSDSIHDTPLNNGSDGRPEDSILHCHPINQNFQFYNHGDPRTTAATEKLLNLSGTILAFLQNQEPRCTPQPSPILGADKLLNLTGNILAILQNQEQRCTPQPSTDLGTDKLLNMTGTILAILQNQETQQTPQPSPILVLDNPRDCAEIQASGQTTSGVYPIYLDGEGNPFFVSCDMETDGGGWTIFQRREDGSVDFFLEWTDYKYGFGNVSSEHWLGNDNIHRLVGQKTYELRVDLEDFTGQTRYANYSTFYLADEDANYTMTLGEYSGDAGDSLSYHSGREFTTKDRDNGDYTNNCASFKKGAWWYGNCHHSNLNGLYLHGTNSQPTQGVVWYHWLGHGYSLKKTEMKIRPVNHRNINE